jgi:hypothetical protein
MEFADWNARHDLAPIGFDLATQLNELPLGGRLLASDQGALLPSDQLNMCCGPWVAVVREGALADQSAHRLERGYETKAAVYRSSPADYCAPTLGHVWGSVSIRCIDASVVVRGEVEAGPTRNVCVVVTTGPQMFGMDTAQAASLVEKLEWVAGAAYSSSMTVITRDFCVAHVMSQKGAAIDVAVQPVFSARKSSDDTFQLAPATSDDRVIVEALQSAVITNDPDTFAMASALADITQGRVARPDTGGPVAITCVRTFSYD